MKRHPYTWYSIHTGRTGILRTREGSRVNKFSKYVFDSLKKDGIIKTAVTLVFENAFPLIGKKIFKNKVGIWDLRWNYMESITKRKLKEISKRKRKIRLLDIGCGAGDLLFEIKKYADSKGIDLEIMGLDIDKDAIEFANTIKKELGVEGFFLVGDIIQETVFYKGREISIKNFLKEWGNPDIVICEGLIEWLDNREFALKNIFYLNPNQLILLTPSEKILENKLAHLMMGVVRILGGEGHKGVSKNELRALLKKTMPKKYKSRINFLQVPNFKGAFMVSDVMKK